MQKLEVSILIKDTPISVYNAIKDMERFPDFMRDVKKLKIIKRAPEAIVTAWEVEIEGVLIKWKEEDIFDDEKLELNFSALEGDYKDYQGRWKIFKEDGQTRLIINAHFDLGSPILEKYVGRILEKRARLALWGMLKAIKNELE